MGTLAEFPCGNRSFKDPGVLPHLSSEATRTLKLWVGLAGRPYARPGGAEHPEPVSNRINRFWELCGQSRSISGTLGAAPGVFNRRDETRRSRFLLLGFCSLLRCNKRAAFLLRCSRLCLFLRRLLLRRLWRFVAHMLITTLGLADASIEPTNFWDCPFDLCASALSHHQLTL